MSERAIVRVSRFGRFGTLADVGHAHEQVGLAPPDGLGGARPTFSIEGVDVLVMELLAA